MNKLRKPALVAPARSAIFTLVSGTAAAHLITAVSTPIVARLYGPEAIGLISIYLSFFNAWVVVLSCRFEGAILLAADEDDAHHIFRLAIIVVVAMSCLSIPLMYFLIAGEVFSYGRLPVWTVLVASLSCLGYGGFMVYRGWSLRVRSVGPIRRATISRSAANASVRILGGVFGLGPFGLFIAEVFGSWAAVGALRASVKKAQTVAPPNWSYQKILEVMNRFRRFPLLEMPSAGLNQVATALPVPMIGAIYGAEAAGWYGLARLLVAIPNMQIGGAVADVFQMEFAKLVRDGRGEAGKRLFYSFATKLSLIGLIPLIASVLLAPTVVPFVFGDDWEPMGKIVALMSPWMYFSLIVGSLSRLLSVLEAQHLKLIYDFFALAVICLVYRYSTGWSLFEFVEIMSLVFVASYVVYGAILAYVVRSRL